MDKSEMQKKIKENEDFIHAPKFGNSLNKYLAKTDNMLENSSIGRLLLLSEEEVEQVYLESVEALKKEMLNDGEEGSD